MGGQSETKTQVAEMDPLQKDYVQTGLNFAKENILNKPFEDYTGKRFAGMTPQEEALLKQYENIDTGAADYLTARGVASGIAQETPEQRAARVSQYANQYTAGVVDPTLAALENQRAKQRVSEAAQRTAAKAFGSRGDVYRGALEGEYQVGMGKTIADLMQRGMDYGTARASAETQERLGAASQLASTAGAGLQAQLTGLGAQAGAYAMPRQLEQQGLDFAFQEFMRQQGYPYQQLAAITGFGGSIPTGYGTTSTTATQDLGLGGALTAFGSFGQGLGAMAPLFKMSDARLKKNVKKIGGHGGINFYTWEWNADGKAAGAEGDPTMGVIAQELEKTHPQYVVVGGDGYKRVNYGGLYKDLGIA